MHYRNVLSLVKGFTASTLLAMTSLGAAPALADDGNQPLALISMLTPETSLPLASIENALVVHEVRTAPAIARAVDLTTPPDDLWIRLRNGFAMTNLNDDLVLYYQQWYQNRPDAMRRMVERSRPYLHYIVEELEARGMPTEIALLPMVESAFNPMAYSRAHASGLWQFIPATGKRFNLEQTWWQDQRRDIVASTDAALEYLQTIYEMHGDWHLALASYNWGEGSVKRAIEKNIARGLPTDYESLTMPTETRHYVPKLQALKNIFNNAALMTALGLPEIINRPYFATVETSRPMDVKTAARMANMSVDEFLALNPSHNRPVIRAETPVVIPAGKLATFQDNLEKHDEPLTKWQAYTLKSGEKIEQIAARFGITLAELKQANGLSGKARLRSGSTVLVPAGKGANSVESISDESHPPQIVEPEPTVKKVANSKTGKQSAKHSKSATSSSKTRVASKSSKNVSSKSAKKAAGSTKTVSTATKSKVAKSGDGRRS